jgi:hypothetical protein
MRRPTLSLGILAALSILAGTIVCIWALRSAPGAAGQLAGAAQWAIAALGALAAALAFALTLAIGQRLQHDSSRGAQGARTEDEDRLEAVMRAHHDVRLGTLSADARVATFLLDLSERFARLGCARSMFMLRMTRQDIGNFLGIQLETVSRTLSGFCAAGLIHVDGKTITLRDTAGLRRIIEPEDDEVMRPIRRARRALA